MLCRNPVDCWVRDVSNCLWLCRTPIGADSHVDEAVNTGKERKKERGRAW
jgi:hypothetical protein